MEKTIIPYGEHYISDEDIDAVCEVLKSDWITQGPTIERFEKSVATFSYKDLYKLVFKDNPKARWFNPDNGNTEGASLGFRDFSDAFDLRLHDATLVKYTNPKDNYIIDVYEQKPKVALGKAFEYEFDLVEYESHTWEN